MPILIIAVFVVTPMTFLIYFTHTPDIIDDDDDDIDDDTPAMMMMICWLMMMIH